MAYDGTGLTYFITNTGPLDTDIVFEGAQWIRDIIAYFNDATNGPTTINQLPVGHIFISTSGTNPNTTLGYGTWTQIAQGRTLIGEGTGSGLTPRTAAAEGGSETVNAEHNHQWYETSGGSGTNHILDTLAGSSGVHSTFDSNGDATTFISTSPNGPTVDMYTDNQLSSISTMQPFLVVYFWERTA